MVSPKGLKPKSHKWISLKAYEKRRKKKKKKGPDQKIEERPVLSRIPRGCQRLGIPEACNTAKTRLRQLKGNAKKHKKRKADMSFSGTRDPARKRRKPRVTTHNARKRNLGEPE